MNLIFLLILLSMNLLMAVIGRIVANPHKNIILETTLPKEHLQDSQVTQVRQTYKLRLIQTALLFSLADLLILFLPYDSLAMLFFLLSIFGLIGVMYFMQVLYVRRMTDVKIKNNWILPTKPLLIDTKLIQNKNRRLIKPYWFIPGIVISFAGCLYTFFILNSAIEVIIFGGISLITLGIFIYSYYLIRRLPVKPMTDDEQINQQVNDAMRYYWSLLLISSVLVFSPLSFLPALSTQAAYEKTLYLVIAYFVLLFAYIGFIFFILFRLRKTQDNLIMQASDYRYGDEDQYWRYGIYINPDDPRIIIPDRLGMNMSVNLGRPAGKAAMILTGIIIVGALIISCVPLLINDFSNDPFQLAISKTEVTMTAPFTRTREIPVTDIRSVQLVDKLPENSIRIYGSATEHYLTGEFRIADRPAYLLVYKNQQPLLKIETLDYTYYYTNKESEKTTQLFKRLQNELNP
ncbi:DUF5808 domain-containing protein [Enterococcus sp. LJL128]